MELDFGRGPLDPPTVDDQTEPRRGRERVDQFLKPTLCKLGDDAFFRLILSQRLDDFRWCSGRISDSGGMRCMVTDDQQGRQERYHTVNSVSVTQPYLREYNVVVLDSSG